MPKGVHITTTAEALALIEAMSAERAKQVLTLLAGQFAGNPAVWPQYSAALGKPARPAEIASAK